MLRKLAVAVTVVLLVPGLALAQAPKKDLPLFDRVAGAVLTYSRYTIFDDLSASVDNGVVTLSGKVTMPFKATDIVRRIQRIPGVTTVKNEIQVLPVSITDNRLRYVLARRIYGNEAFWTYAIMANPPIHIVVENGHVTLTGVVNSNVERMLVRSLVSGVYGIFSVDNQLKTDAEMNALVAHGN